MITPSKRTCIEQANYVTAELQAVGLDRNELSRFSLLLRHFGDGEMIQSDHPRFNEVLENERDRQTLTFIFDHIGNLKGSAEFNSLLRLLVKDSALPEGAGKLSKGRDAQFHLLLAATCQNAGLQPQLAEPDIVCKIDGKDFGVAAKRLKSLERLDERIDEGVDQLRRADMPGVIAIDVTIALNPENRRYIAAGEADRFMSLLEVAMYRFVHQRIDGFRRRLHGTRVRGLLFVNTFVVVGKVHEPEFLSYNYGVCTVKGSPDRKLHFHKFHRAFAGGTYNPQNDPPRALSRRELARKKKPR